MSIQNKMTLISLVLLVVGAVGYFILPRNILLFYLFAHLGALGLMGLFGSGAGALAQWKSRSFWRAFALGAILPIVGGMAAVFIFMWGSRGQLFCGGSVCLAIAVLVTLVYALMSKKAVRAAA